MKGVIFDFNGVLLWDNHLQEKAWKQFSKQLRGTALSDVEMAEHVHGRVNRHTLEYLARRPLSADEADTLSEQKENIYRNLCLENTDSFCLSPGAIQLLDFLVANHIPHTIATASGKGNVNFFIEYLHLELWFQLDRIVYDNGSFPGKPAPDIYKIAAQIIGMAPQDCIVIEDSQSGIKSAIRAGIGKVVALHPNGERPPGAHTVIKSLQNFDHRWVQ